MSERYFRWLLFLRRHKGIFDETFWVLQNMADYWKSQPRKFCEFCKCWIADNKPSRDFHERGKRHLENVQQKLDDLRKKGVRDTEKQEEMSESLRQMEEAALKAFKEDLKNNPALAAQYNVMTKSKEEKPQKTSSWTCDNKPSEQGTWSEAQSPEGYTYYWNDVSGETTWEKPTDFVAATTKSFHSLSVSVDRKGEISNTTLATQATCLNLAETKKKKPQAYGSWEPVKAESSLDLQLPEEEVVKEEPKVKRKEELKLKFVEKKVESLGAPMEDTVVSFKKRKTNSGAARSIKRRERD
ncbi:WW domain-binding protein 4 [Lamellibrachia satsuma]|nr:WW domain-binding protein 4 [Lamellibrachia satsuma]